MSNDAENTKKYLFNSAMKGRWDEVVDVYMRNPTIHAAKTAKSGDTALHIAVSDEQVVVVAKMVDIVQCQHADPKEILGVQNERKNTALHFAASMGNVAMCQIIANVDRLLVRIRNMYGETPLFLAALHGRRDAFLCLHHICTTNCDCAPNYGYCRRNDGDTILHCAIAGDYFDLAFQIIHLYGELVNWLNEKCFTPLHLLASKPSAFKSGSRLGRLEKFIYPLIYIEELKVAQHDPQTNSTAAIGNRKFELPENYRTLFNLYMVLRKAVIFVSNKFLWKRHDEEEENNPGAQEENESVVLSANDLEAQKRSKRGRRSGSQLNHEAEAQTRKLVPANSDTCFRFVKFVYLAMLVILGQGTDGIKGIYRKKQKHVWSVQLMNKLLDRASLYEYDNLYEGQVPQSSSLTDTGTDVDEGTVPYAIDHELDIVVISNIVKMEHTFNTQNRGDDQKNKDLAVVKKETPLLIAAKNGVIEMVEKILELFPLAIHDRDADNKNIFLLAVENRQLEVYGLLLEPTILKESLFRNVDKWGNSALHLAAKLQAYKPWLYHNTAAQHMQWEIMWYKFIKKSVPSQHFEQYNEKNETADEIFSETHKDLVEKGGAWMNKTSESCSLVATLIATVAFATSTAIPGGVQENTGKPNLQDHPAFMISAMSSLVALYGSVTSMVMFLSILSSNHQEYDFGTALPRKLMAGLTTLFVSTVAMLVSFSAGHYLSVQSKLEHTAFLIYAVASLPLVLFSLSRFPIYLHTLRGATLVKQLN